MSETGIAELNQRLHLAHNRLRSFYETAQAINSTLELPQVLERLVRSTAEAMQIQACTIRMLDETRKQLRLTAAHGLSDNYLQKQLVLQVDPTVQNVLSGQVVSIGDATTDLRWTYRAEAAAENIHSILIAPLLGKRKPLGLVLAVSHQRDFFTDDDAVFLTAIASQGSAAIENAVAYQTLSQLDEMKSKFVLTITHELRSPVNVIRTLLRTMDAGYTGELTDDQRNIIERVMRRADFLQTLIDDLLDLAAGKSQLRAECTIVPFDQVVRRVVERHEMSAQEKQLLLEWSCECGDEPVAVSATEDGLDCVVNNLVSNAIKYTRTGGRVSVRLARLDGQACLQVNDSGIGIPEDSLKHLFEEFFRAPNAKAIEREGTGLGLAITRDLVTHYGGQIVVQSKVGQGTTFTVTLPTVRAEIKRRRDEDSRV